MSVCAYSGNVLFSHVSVASTLCVRECVLGEVLHTVCVCVFGEVLFSHASTHTTNQ